MNLIFCDCCGKETKSVNHFTYLCHLEDKSHTNGYVDNEMNRVSGRHVSKDLCNKCYNDVVSASVNKFLELKEKYKINFTMTNEKLMEIK